MLAGTGVALGTGLIVVSCIRPDQAWAFWKVPRKALAIEWLLAVRARNLHWRSWSESKRDSTESGGGRLQPQTTSLRDRNNRIWVTSGSEKCLQPHTKCWH